MISGMNMKRVYTYITILLSAFVLSAPAMGGNINAFSVYLQMDKLKFYASEDITVNVVIRNITDELATFYVYDLPGRTDLFDRPRGDAADYNTFKPVVYDMTGKTAEIIVPYVISAKNQKDTLSWMKRREVRLGPGETFTHSQNIKRIYNLQSDNEYRIRLHFFPFIGEQDENKLAISSNELVFRVTRDRAYLPYQAKELGGIRIVPSEVVLLVLNAERDGTWERMIKYLDLGKYIHSYPDFARKYDMADDYDKKNIEKDFTRYLISVRKSPLSDFKVIDEEIEASGLISYVTVSVTRKRLLKPERYKYIYKLERNSIDDNIWLVSGIEARVIKDVIKK